MNFIKTSIKINYSRSSIRSARGFTLIEVLISILILSFGLIALAGLQIQTMKFVQGAAYRNMATAQINSMGEIMRGNRTEINNGTFNNPVGVGTTACFSSVGCTSSQMALTQYFIWQQSTAALLPNGVGVVCVDSTPNDGTAAVPACDNVVGAPYVVKIFWTDDKVGTAARFVTPLNP